MKRPKRKIEDLKPNDFIYVETLKQAKKLFKMCGFHAWPVSKVWIGINNIGLFWQSEEIMTGSEYPASDFIGKKKSKTAKRLDRIEKRLEAIEKEYDFVANCNAMPAIEEKPFVLPEKWCIRVNSLNFIGVRRWFNENKQLDTDFDYTSINGALLHYPIPENLAGHYCIEIQEGYTEITTEQFIEHVLKLEAKEECVKNAMDAVKDVLKPKEIDFSIAGQLVYQDGNIFITEGRETEDFYTKYDIVGNSFFHSIGWAEKASTKLYNGTIMLKNN